MNSSPSIRHHLLRYTLAMMAQIDQTALFNSRATLLHRLARWLLMCHDRIRGDTIELTHKFLSDMLGVRRAGVTEGTHMLEGYGLIRASRGAITILDRLGLEDAANQTYGLPEAEYRRLVGWAKTSQPTT